MALGPGGLTILCGGDPCPRTPPAHGRTFAINVLDSPRAGWANYIMWGDPQWRPPPTWKSEYKSKFPLFHVGGGRHEGSPHMK